MTPLLTWLSLPERSDREEILDGPLPAADALLSNLRELAWVNRWAGGAAVVLDALETIVDRRRARPVRVLDLATGGADIPMAIARWGRETGLEVSIDAIDSRQEIVDLARELTAGEPGIRVARGDALALDLPPESHDIVVCSLALHHFDPAGAVRLLREGWRVARHALVVNDLRRSRLAWVATTCVARTVFRSPEARHDGPLSVLRAYTIAEVEELARRAGIPSFEVAPCSPFRLRLIASRAPRERAVIPR